MRRQNLSMDNKHRSLSYAEKMASSFLVAFSFDNLSIGQKNNTWTVDVHYFFLIELAFFFVYNSVLDFPIFIMLAALLYQRFCLMRMISCS